MTIVLNTGRIEAGFEADILVLNANPLDSLEELKNIDVLIKDGQIIDRQSLLEIADLGGEPNVEANLETKP